MSENYPKKGKKWCSENMGLTDAQIRSKASRLGLVARGVSEAWSQKQEDHAKKLTGRKRPDQSIVMKMLHENGKLKTDKQIAASSARMKEWRAKNDHPRGATGMKHTKEAKSAMSAKSAAAWAAMPDDIRQARTVKMMKTRSENGTYAPERIGSTWKAGWREINGVRKYYRSRWEANYAYYLEWLRSGGHIAEWKHEPKTFWFEGVKRGTVSYLPDFWVMEKDGTDSFHEVKGWMDDRSKTKIKRMAKYYPNVKLVVIDSKGYAALKKSVSSLVPGWEE